MGYENRKKRKVFLLAVLVLFLFAGTGITAGAEADNTVPEELRELYAQSAVLMDADSGRILFEKNGQEFRPMASTTKIMTLILALEMTDLQSVVTVSEYAASMPEVKLHMQKGEQYYLRDLYASLMLESHNDTAAAIAEYTAGELHSPLLTGEQSPEESRLLLAEFAELMNAKARDIGCQNTHFVTPNGLDGEDEGGAHGTTAADLAKILRYCIAVSPERAAFLEITGRESASFSDISGSRSFTVYNHNAFLKMMDGALTGKTGFTGKAGYCYVGAVRRDGKTLIAALLACGWPNHKSYKWKDMRRLMDYGLEHCEFHCFAEAELPKLMPIPVTGGKSEVIGGMVYVPVGRREKSDPKAGLLLNEQEKLETECRLAKQLSAPVEEGSIVGKIIYRVGSEVVRTELLTAAASAKKADFCWCLRLTGLSCFSVGL